jgi:hypothetical protein
MEMDIPAVQSNHTTYEQREYRRRYKLITSGTGGSISDLLRKIPVTPLGELFSSGQQVIFPMVSVLSSVYLPSSGTSMLHTRGR